VGSGMDMTVTEEVDSDEMAARGADVRGCRIRRYSNVDAGDSLLG